MQSFKLKMYLIFDCEEKSNHYAWKIKIVQVQIRIKLKNLAQQ